MGASYVRVVDVKAFNRPLESEPGKGKLVCRPLRALHVAQAVNPPGWKLGARSATGYGGKT